MTNILQKPYTNKQYADFAVYANSNNLIIEDKGDYLELVSPPEPTEEEIRLRLDSIFVTKLQFFKAIKELHNISYTDIMPMIEGDPNAKLEFELSSGFLRGNPLFNAFAPFLNLTPDDMDIIFQKALEY